MDKLLTLNEVIECVSMTKSTIYRYINKNAFPPPLKMNPNDPNSASRWRESEITEFIDSRPRALNK